MFGSRICSTTPSKTLHLSTNPRKTAPRDHPRSPKTTQDHRNHRNHRNRSKTLHLSPNPRKRASEVTSWRSKTLHPSTNPRNRLPETTQDHPRPPKSPKSLENTAPVDKSKKTGLRGHFLAFENTAPVDKSEKRAFENIAPVDKSTFGGTGCSNRLLRSDWALENIVFCCTLLDNTSKNAVFCCTLLELAAPESLGARKHCVLLHFARQRFEKHNAFAALCSTATQKHSVLLTLLDHTSKTQCLAALCSTTLRKRKVLLHFARQHLENTSSDSLIFPSKSLFEVTVRSHCSKSLHFFEPAP